MMKYSYLIFLFVFLFFYTCDQGLSPEKEVQASGEISGTVFFKNWPPADSLFDIRLVLFPFYPDSNIILEITSGRAVVYPGLTDTTRLPFYVESLNYRFSLKAGHYEYFAVAHRYGPGIFSDWQVVGHYDTTAQDALPTALNIEPGQTLTDIFIVADFDSVLLRP